MSRQARGVPSLDQATWPDADRQAWQAALQPKRFRCSGGTASHWRPQTERGYRWIYGRWLRFLHDHEPEALQQPPTARMTEGRLVSFVDELQDTISALSVWSYVSKLHNAFYGVFPAGDWSWLREIVNELQGLRPDSTIDETSLVGIHVLYALGFEMMEEAERGDVGKRSNIAPHYRNGLMIAFLAETLIRLSNLTQLDLDRHLMKPASRWQLAIPADEVKNGKRVEQTLSPRLSRAMDRFVDAYRPQLLGANECDRLWINHLAQPFKEHRVAQRICKVTLRRLGKAVPPQRFRNCAATTLAVYRPEMTGLTPSLLNHWNQLTYQRHYNRAGQASALKRYHEVLNENLGE